MEKEEEERQKEGEEEEEEALRKGERDAWKLDRNKLPCHEPAKHGYMWRFDTKSSKHHWEQLVRKYEGPSRFVSDESARFAVFKRKVVIMNGSQGEFL